MQSDGEYFEVVADVLPERKYEIAGRHIDRRENNMQSVTGNCLVSHLKGLRAVLQVLLCQIPTERSKEVRQSYITFDEAFGLYLAYPEKKTLDVNSRC